MTNAVLGICGWSGSGKTTLIEQLLLVFRGMGLQVNVIKHSHHVPAMEPPTKDSARFREAGAQEVLLATPWGYVFSHPLRDMIEPSLTELLTRLMPADLTLVEGFKQETIPRLEVWRAANGKPLLAPSDCGIVAVACDTALECGAPRLDLNNIDEIADFIVGYFALFNIRTTLESHARF